MEEEQHHYMTASQPESDHYDRGRLEYELTVRQEPKQARMCGVGADRRPIDPPPIVQLRVIDPATRRPPSAAGSRASSPGASSSSAHAQSFLQNPYYFMFASLAKPDEDVELHWLKDGKTRCTTGSVVSSLYHLKDSENANEDAGFFVFPDLSVRTEGSYRLKLSLYEVVGSNVHHCKSIFSAPFYVYTAKKFPGMEESTPLSCSLADQGIKIRIRKDIRVRKRPQNGDGPTPIPMPLPMPLPEGGNSHTVFPSSSVPPVRLDPPDVPENTEVDRDRERAREAEKERERERERARDRDHQEREGERERKRPGASDRKASSSNANVPRRESVGERAGKRSRDDDYGSGDTQSRGPPQPIIPPPQSSTIAWGPHPADAPPSAPASLPPPPPPPSNAPESSHYPTPAPAPVPAPAPAPASYEHRYPPPAPAPAPAPPAPAPAPVYHSSYEHHPQSHAPPASNYYVSPPPPAQPTYAQHMPPPPPPHAPSSYTHPSYPPPPGPGTAWGPHPPPAPAPAPAPPTSGYDPYGHYPPPPPPPSHHTAPQHHVAPPAAHHPPPQSYNDYHSYSAPHAQSHSQAQGSYGGHYEHPPPPQHHAPPAQHHPHTSHPSHYTPPSPPSAPNGSGSGGGSSLGYDYGNSAPNTGYRSEDSRQAHPSSQGATHSPTASNRGYAPYGAPSSMPPPPPPPSAPSTQYHYAPPQQPYAPPPAPIQAQSAPRYTHPPPPQSSGHRGHYQLSPSSTTQHSAGYPVPPPNDNLGGSSSWGAQTSGYAAAPLQAATWSASGPVQQDHHPVYGGGGYGNAGPRLAPLRGQLTPPPPGGGSSHAQGGDRGKKNPLNINNMLSNDA